MPGPRRNEEAALGMLVYEKTLYEDLGSFYAQGSRDASDDWERRRDWMFERANLNSGMTKFVLQTYYKRFVLPESEPEAHGSREAGVLIQQARLKYGFRLTHRDLQEFVVGKCWTLDETVAHLNKHCDVPGRKAIHEDDVELLKIARMSVTSPQASSKQKKKRSLLPVPTKPTTKLGGTLKPVSEEEEDEGYFSHGREPEAGVVITFQAGRYDLPEMYQHLVTDLEGMDTAKMSVTALIIERSATLPMPVSIAEDWQKEAILVLRVLTKLIDHKLGALRTSK
ncbi:hypothetical protein PG996_010040 [Apiospora saccharicola]|uniref:Clr5 domain-containing protein n=1 Tax=Apiospora saccharicola TaxID=335842 RepID=A0ABR1UPX3_9PEZI